MYCSFIANGGLGETNSSISHSGCLDVFMNTIPVNNSFPTPPSFSTVSGNTLIDWDAFSDVNLHTYEVFFINESSILSLRTDMLLLHRLENENITDVLDYSPNVFNSVGNAVTIGSSKGDQGTGDFAVQFDGLDDTYLEVSANVVLGINDSALSVGGWFNRDAINTAQTLVSLTMESGTANVFIRFESTNELRCGARSITADSLQSAFTVEQFIDIVGWHHFVCVYNLDNDSINIFIDGVEASITGAPFSFIAPTFNSSHHSTKSSAIGSNDNNEVVFNGLLDEIFMYEIPLTGSEVSTIFNSGHFNVTNSTSFFPLGNTTGAVSQLFFNFSTILTGINYTINVRGYDDFDTVGLGFNSFILNQLFVPPLPPGFFNVSHLNPNAVSFVASDLPINFTWSSMTNGSIESNCTFYINETAFENFTVNVSAGINFFSQSFNTILPNGSYVWNVSCERGVNINNALPFNFSTDSLPSPPVIGGLFDIGNCPSTLVEVLLYIFFYLLFISLSVWGLYHAKLLTSLGSLGLFMMSLSVMSCIGFVLAILLMIISGLFGLYSVWDLFDLRRSKN